MKHIKTGAIEFFGKVISLQGSTAATYLVSMVDGLVSFLGDSDDWEIETESEELMRKDDGVYWRQMLKDNED